MLSAAITTAAITTSTTFTTTTSATAAGPLLWYANRGSGFVLLALLTTTTALGVLAAIAPGSTAWPRAATQAMHRNVGLLSVAFLLVHIATAVADEFVDIRWWHSLIPFASPYLRLWLGFGVISFDALLAVVITSVLRRRLRHIVWRSVHVLTYGAWVLGVVHALGIGTDARDHWGLIVTAGCVAVVATAIGARIATLGSASPRSGAPTAAPVAVTRRTLP